MAYFHFTADTWEKAKDVEAEALKSALEDNSSESGSDPSSSDSSSDGEGSDVSQLGLEKATGKPKRKARPKASSAAASATTAAPAAAEVAVAPKASKGQANNEKALESAKASLQAVISITPSAIYGGGMKDMKSKLDKAKTHISSLSEANAQNPNAEADQTVSLLELDVQRVEGQISTCQLLKDSEGCYQLLEEKAEEFTAFMKVVDASTAVKILGSVGARLRDESWVHLGRLYLSLWKQSKGLSISLGVSILSC